MQSSPGDWTSGDLGDQADPGNVEDQSTVGAFDDAYGDYDPSAAMTASDVSFGNPDSPSYSSLSQKEQDASMGYNDALQQQQMAMVGMSNGAIAQSNTFSAANELQENNSLANAGAAAPGDGAFGYGGNDDDMDGSSSGV